MAAASASIQLGQQPLDTPDDKSEIPDQVFQQFEEQATQGLFPFQHPLIARVLVSCPTSQYKNDIKEMMHDLGACSAGILPLSSTMIEVLFVFAMDTDELVTTTYPKLAEDISNALPSSGTATLAVVPCPKMAAEYWKWRMRVHKTKECLWFSWKAKQILMKPLQNVDSLSSLVLQDLLF